jgi:hypothetical protein
MPRTAKSIVSANNEEIANHTISFSFVAEDLRKPPFYTPLAGAIFLR